MRGTRKVKEIKIFGFVYTRLHALARGETSTYNNVGHKKQALN